MTTRTLWSRRIGSVHRRYVEVWRNGREAERDARRYHFRRINWHSGRYVTLVLAPFGVRLTVKYA